MASSASMALLSPPFCNDVCVVVFGSPPDFLTVPSVLQDASRQCASFHHTQARKITSY